MNRNQALLSILFVAIVLGAALGAIFLPLLKYERDMGDERQFRIWLAEWVFFDLLLTAVLCRREIRFLIRGARPSTAPLASTNSESPGKGTG